MIKSKNCSCLRAPLEIRARERGRGGAWLHMNGRQPQELARETLMPRTTRSERAREG